MLGAARLAQVPRSAGGNADAAAYIAAAGITDATWIAALETFFNDTVAVRAKLDAFWLWANQGATAARTDLIVPARTLLTLVSVSGFIEEEFFTIPPNFTQWRGYSCGSTFDGSAHTRLSISFDYSAAKFNGTNGAFACFYKNNTSTGGEETVFRGTPTGGAFDFRITSSHVARARIGSNGSEAAVDAYGGQTGLTAVSATGGTYRFSRNGSTFAGNSVSQNATTGTSTLNLNPTQGRIAALGLGEALSDAETTAFYTALQTLLTVKGAQA